MLVDADGTRHSYTGNITEFTVGHDSVVMHTTDGSFIDYSYLTGTNGVNHLRRKQNCPTAPSSTTARIPEPGAESFQHRIQDPNGNYITITYVNNAGPRIQTIVDTLNRPINFYYDSTIY